MTNSSSIDRNIGRRAGVVLALALVASVPFLPVLGNGFAGWDDTVNFLTNRDFRGLDWGNLTWAWSTYLMGVYQPIGWMIYEAEYVAWGMEPRWYHLVSILFHAANVLALWALVCALIARIDRAAGRQGVDGETAAVASAVAVALYAVHPLRVEAVAWASCQSYLPGIFFAILSVIAYLRAADGRKGWLALAWLSFAVALLTKVAVISLPFVLLILDVYPLRRIGPGRWWGKEAWRVYGEKLLFVALAVPFMVFAVQARWPTGQRPEVGLQDLGPRLAQSVYGIWFYPIKTVFPFRISAHYPLPTGPRGYATWHFAAAAVATAVACATALYYRRRFPGLVAAWACYLVCLGPSLGLIRTSQNIASDRYCYVASMAGVVVLAYALTRLADRPDRWRRALIVAAGLTVALAGLTWRQCLTWRSTATLWVQTGYDGRAHYESQLKAGLDRLREGRTAAAKHHFLQALTDDPDSVPALLNLGEIYWQEGKVDESREMCDRADAHQPDLVEADETA